MTDPDFRALSESLQLIKDWDKSLAVLEAAASGSARETKCKQLKELLDSVASEINSTRHNLCLGWIIEQIEELDGDR